MHKSFLRLFVIAAVAALAVTFFPTTALAQVVSSGMTGTLTNGAGKPLAGVPVTAVHTPTNTKFSAVTGPSGRFSFKGMPVGGPYTVTATPANTAPVELTDITTSLGEDTDVQLITKEEVLQLEKFVVQSSNNELDANATGASSVLSNQRILAQPTVNRSFTDFAKTNPFVTVRGFPQFQALGMNNRYNSITLDGAKINDSFGLNSSGLFSLNNPFSIDAVEQFSVSLTPYDVRQSGFAGLALNVVSKSGTNEFHGTAYDLFTDQNWQGPDEFGSTIHKRTPFKQRTYGFTLGGPIWKDKVFFFVNWEKFIQDSLPSFAGYTPDPAFLTAVTAKIATLPGAPNLGTWGGASTTRQFDNKRLAKVDWNITQDHRLSVRYSDTTGALPNFGYFNYTSFSQPVTPTNTPSLTNLGTGFNSSLYNLAVKEKVWAGQLFSNWSSNLKTEFDYSNTKQDSVRAVPINFPSIRIFNVPGTASTGTAITANDAFVFGTEISSMGNELHIKTQTMTGSADYTWKDFTFSAGADHETSDYLNLFRQGSYGYFSYWNLSDFQNDLPFGFDRAVVQTGFPAADISKFERTGIFGQVKWSPSSRLSVILGLRTDLVNSPIAPPVNTAFQTAFGMTNAGTIDGTSVPQPRLSFNYALDSKRLTQIRGGYGVFLGRNPWVWISNSYGNSGVGRFNTFLHTPAAVPAGTQPNTAAYTGPTLAQYLSGTYSNTDPSFKFDPANPVGTTAVAGTASSINLIRPGMKLPTIARGNLAIDHKIPGLDATLTVEYINTEQLSALVVQNLNLKATTIGADGRQRFAGASSGANALNPAFANVIYTRDVKAGKSQYASISLDHPMKNHWAWNVAYTRGHATEASTLNSSTANSQFNFNPVFNQNTVEISRSDYEVKDRLQASLSREFLFFKGYVSTVSLYYEGRSGQPYSWVYSGDVNGDGVFGNDLLAVPSGPTDPRFDFSTMSAANQTGYFAFLAANGLTKYAGSYIPRDAMLGPWQNRLDLNLRQEIPIASAWGKHVKLELFLDFLNIGSFLSKNLFNYVEEINTGTTFGGLTRVLGNATYNANGQIVPTFTADANGNVVLPASSLITVNNGDSRWRIQGGIKLKF
jgi:hypothetical protein